MVQGAGGCCTASDGTVLANRDCAAPGCLIGQLAVGFSGAGEHARILHLPDKLSICATFHTHLLFEP